MKIFYLVSLIFIGVLAACKSSKEQAENADNAATRYGESLHKSELNAGDTMADFNKAIKEREKEIKQGENLP